MIDFDKVIPTAKDNCFAFLDDNLVFAWLMK